LGVKGTRCEAQKLGSLSDRQQALRHNPTASSMLELPRVNLIIVCHYNSL
jgi:hypothetical protein